MSIARGMNQFVKKSLEKYVQPWEYTEIRVALENALGKYTKEEIAEALRVDPKLVTLWRQKVRIPTREKFNQLKNIEQLVKQ